VYRAARSKWNTLCAARRDRFRSTEVSGDVHEEGSGGGERWNYASVHLTECDESDRNSTEAESGAEPSE